LFLRARRRSQVRRAAAAWRRENHFGNRADLHNMRSFYTEIPTACQWNFFNTRHEPNGQATPRITDAHTFLLDQDQDGWVRVIHQP
jgi:hypothetical protein